MARAFRQFRHHDLTHSPDGLWQFDGDLTDDSGNGYTLTAGAGTARYTTIHGIRGLVFDGTFYAEGDTGDTNLRSLGALTVEMILVLASWPGVSPNSDVGIIAHGASGATSAENVNYELRATATTGRMEWGHENGTKSDDYVNVEAPAPGGVACHYCITRDATALDVRAYIDGIEIVNPALGAAPTAGTSGFLKVGAKEGGADPMVGAIASLKIITGTELTAAQVLAEARRTVL